MAVANKRRCLRGQRTEKRSHKGSLLGKECPKAFLQRHVGDLIKHMRWQPGCGEYRVFLQMLVDQGFEPLCRCFPVEPEDGSESGFVAEDLNGSIEQRLHPACKGTAQMGVADG